MGMGKCASFRGLRRVKILCCKMEILCTDRGLVLLIQTVLKKPTNAVPLTPYTGSSQLDHVQKTYKCSATQAIQWVFSITPCSENLPMQCYSHSSLGVLIQTIFRNRTNVVPLTLFIGHSQLDHVHKTYECSIIHTIHWVFLFRPYSENLPVQHHSQNEYSQLPTNVLTLTQ